MLTSATEVPVQRYLETVYRPDRDYVDGELLERNAGEIPHGRLQGFFVKFFGAREQDWQLEAIPELRVQVAATRFRVPDVCVVPLSMTDTLIVRTPPVVCIEVLSREDRMSEMQERVDDYTRMGVSAVWIVDPWRRVAFVGGELGRLLPEETALRIPGLNAAIPIADIFAALDRNPSLKR